MSADNTILIMEFWDKTFRVGEFGNIEDLYYNPETHDYVEYIVPSQVYSFFKGKPEFDNQEKAMEYAFLLYEDIGYVEYGIQKSKMELTWKEIETSFNENK